jgi:GT2 family glycosyltransferase
MIPAVSVVLPAYLSHQTIAGSLVALRQQTWRDFEIVVADSSPDERTARIVATEFPEVTLVRSPTRLLPHGARNLGVAHARASLLVFSDPDVYARPDWLAALVAAHRSRGGVVVGALADHGTSWSERGIHLCKFSKWLPGQPAGDVDNCPTANLLVPRRLFEAIGGLRADHFLGDAWFSWQLRARGEVLHFAPDAIVVHHHLSTVREFLRERFWRGVQFGDLRADWARFGRAKLVLYLAVSLLPLRLPRVLVLVARHCGRAGELVSFLRTLPLIALGHQASLLGESVAYARRLMHPAGPRLPSPSQRPA